MESWRSIRRIKEVIYMKFVSVNVRGRKQTMLDVREIWCDAAYDCDTPDDAIEALDTQETVLILSEQEAFNLLKVLQIVLS